MKLVIADPINRTHQADLATTYNNLGFLASRNKDWQRAEVWYGDAIRLQENLVKNSPLAGKYRRDLAISYNNLGRRRAAAISSTTGSNRSKEPRHKTFCSSHSRKMGNCSAIKATSGTICEWYTITNVSLRKPQPPTRRRFILKAAAL